ncbi:MAG TPA: PAS domain S-box protein, partial [Aggregatilineales bacterium]|nr:PAS domain S-box protein [Aggregatilineales bacterium]
MNDEARSKAELIAELNALRNRVKLLEAASSPVPEVEEQPLLRNFIDTVPDFLYLKDRNSRFLMGNRSQWRLFGLSSEAELLGKTDFDFYPEEIATRYFEDEQQIIKTGQPLINSEEPFYDVVTGDHGWEMATKVPLYDSSGEIIGILGITRNITELKQTREALADAHSMLEKKVDQRTAELVEANRILQAEIEERELVESLLSEERNILRTLLDIIPDGIYIKDSESRFILVNRACARNMGFDDPEQIYGKTDFDFFPPEDARQFRADEVQLMQTGIPLINREEVSYTAENLQTRWILTTKVPRQDDNGNISGIVGIGRDITDRKTVNEALREYQHFIETVMSAVPGVVYIFDLVEQRNIFINRALFELLDYTPEDIDEMGGDILVKLLHPDDREHIGTSPAQWKNVSDDEALTFEYRMQHRDGSWRWFSARDQVFERLPDGTVQQIVGTAQDITERKRTETALLESEAQYRLLMQQASDGILIADESEHYVDANSRICEMLGYTREELLQLGISDIISPEDLARQPVPWEDMREGTVLMERDLMRKDGTICPVEVSARQMPDGRLQAIVRDISERRITEAALRESLQFNEHVISNAGEGINVYDRNLNYLSWNAMMEELTGLSADEVIGKSALQLLPQIRENGIYDLLLRALRGETARSTDIYYTLEKTGKSGWMKGTYAPYRNADGEIIGVIGIISDTTRQKQAEQQAIDLTLERERVKMLANFINGISHDLKTPLTVIRTSVYLLKKHTDPDHRQRHMQRLENQIDHLENLLNDILTMSRLDNV